MRTLLGHKPSPAMVVACLALLVALGGTGIAAVNAVAPNSVGTIQLQNGSVTSAKVQDFTLRNVDFRPGTLLRGPRGARGAAGAPGPKGDKGDKGEKGDAGAIGAITVRTAAIAVPGGIAQNSAYSTRAVQKTCDPGERAISGGTSWSDDVDDLELTTVWLKPVLDASNNVVGFNAKGGNDSGNNSTFTVQVLCYKA